MIGLQVLISLLLVAANVILFMQVEWSDTEHDAMNPPEGFCGTTQAFIYESSARERSPRGFLVYEKYCRSCHSLEENWKEWPPNRRPPNMWRTLNELGTSTVYAYAMDETQSTVPYFDANRKYWAKQTGYDWNHQYGKHLTEEEKKALLEVMGGR